MSDEVLLLGLPGCGRNRFSQALLNHCQSLQVNTPTLLRELDDSRQAKGRVWTLIDIRSELSHPEADAYLAACVARSSAVVLMFAESAELTKQAFWQNWLKRQDVALPVLRWFSQSFSDEWDWQTLGQVQLFPANEAIALPLDSLTFEVGKVSLEHLLFGLDTVKQNLAMDIWRVQAKVKTQEYVNPVAIEGTVNRWDTFAANEVEGRVKILGKSLDEAMLTEIINASELT